MTALLDRRPPTGLVARGLVDEARGMRPDYPDECECRWLVDQGTSSKCEAKTRQGTRCSSPSMENGRCRMHGGKSTGAPKGNRNAWKHGRYSKETLEARRLVQVLTRLAKSTLHHV